MINDGDTAALHAAVQEGSVEKVDWLLVRGVDAEAVVQTGWTPLFTTAYHGPFVVE